MINKLKQKSKFEVIVTFSVIIYILYLLFRIISAVLLTAAYPNEYREAANIAMTQAILNGVNIYSPQNSMSFTPTVCYLYGPLMSVIAAVLKLLLPGVSIPMLHYIISFLAMVISAILLAILVSENSRTIIAGPVAFMLTIFCHWRYGYVYGAPDSLGLCLMIGVLFALYRCAYPKEKGIRSITWSHMAAGLVIMTFFTKQYFIVVALTGGIYLLFVSKRLFVRYAVTGVLGSGVVFGLISAFCPLYWTYSLYFLKGPGAGAAMGKTGKAYNGMQISYLGGMLLMLFIAMTVLLCLLLGAFLIYGKITISLRNYDGAVFTIKRRRDKVNLVSQYVNRMQFYALTFIHMLIAGIILSYIGKNDGAFLSYYLQLFTPGLIIAAVCLIDGFDWKELLKRNKKLGSALFMISYLLFIAYTIYKVEPRLIINQLSKEEITDWERAYEIADAYIDEKGDGARDSIYYVPPMNYHGYANNQYIYNDGQPFVFTQKFLKAYNDSEIAQQLYPYGGVIIKQHLDFREAMRQRVLEGDYELVMFIEDQDPVFTLEELEKEYKCIETISLRTGNWSWPVQFWVKK